VVRLEALPSARTLRDALRAGAKRAPLAAVARG
jgi:hypothetical protein